MRVIRCLLYFTITYLSTRNSLLRDWLLRRLASASLNVFPLESSAMCNKKATLASGFLVAHCARDSGGIRTHDPQLRRLLLYPAELRNHPLPHPKPQNTPPSYGVSHSLQSVASRQRMLMRCKSK